LVFTSGPFVKVTLFGALDVTGPVGRVLGVILEVVDLLSIKRLAGSDLGIKIQFKNI
jgi:hypothetical protein